MAELAPAEFEQRARQHPRLAAAARRLQQHYRGRLHGNWGAPFSLRATLPEGRLELDLLPRRVILRLERTRLPQGLDCTTNPEFHPWPYPRRLGVLHSGLGASWFGGRGAEVASSRAFLARHTTVLGSFLARRGNWISLGSDSVFAGFTARDGEGVEAMVEQVRSLATRPPRAARTPRFTGRVPTLTALRRWPNWERALDEEDAAGQDESTLRPAVVQDRLLAGTACTVGEARTADGRVVPTALLGDLARGDVDELHFLAPGRRAVVVVGNRRWTPAGTATGPRDAALPLCVTSLLSRRRGGPLRVTLLAGGRLRRS